MINAGITGVGGYVPEEIITNFDLEKLVDTNDEWIRSRTGISERRILRGDGLGLSYMAVRAVKELLDKTDTDPNSIDLVLCATITADRVFPDTANLIRHELGITSGFGFDIHAACSGFLYAMSTGAQHIKTGMCKKVVVIGGDKMSSIIDYTDRSTCIIFGDGCGAVLLEAVEEDTGIIDSVLKSDGDGAKYLNMKSGGSLYPTTIETVTNREHFVFQDGRPVFKAAVKGMIDTLQTVIKRNEINNEEIDWIVPHQANLRIINAVASGIDAPNAEVMKIIEHYGNTTAGTLPLCLWAYEDKLKKGDKLLMTAFGGGYTWGSSYIIWSY